MWNNSNTVLCFHRKEVSVIHSHGSNTTSVANAPLMQATTEVYPDYEGKDNYDDQKMAFMALIIIKFMSAIRQVNSDVTRLDFSWEVLGSNFGRVTD
jgi:hypothetical protein